jgi:hypothetical protein
MVGWVARQEMAAGYAGRGIPRSGAMGKVPGVLWMTGAGVSILFIIHKSTKGLKDISRSNYSFQNRAVSWTMSTMC